MREIERAIALLEGIAENIEAGFIQGPGAPVSEERLEAMRGHLKRFVDQEALYRVWSEKEAKVARYFAGILREHARDDDPTTPNGEFRDTPLTCG